LVQAGGITCGDADLSGLSSKIYVSPTGADTPTCGASVVSACASIAKGIAACGPSGCGVLVRYGRYQAEPATTTALREGVNVYGGCVFEGPTRGYRTVLQAQPAPGSPAVSAVGINKPTTVHGLVVIGKNETAAGTASIAMTVTDSKGLTLVNCVLDAGNAGNGATGGTTQGQPGGGGSSGGPNGGG